MSLPVACVCGHEWPDLRGFEGQLVHCPSCGNPVRVPGKARAAAGTSQEALRETPPPLQRFGTAANPAGTPRAIEPARPTWLGTGKVEKPAEERQDEGPELKVLTASGGAHVFTIKYREELYPSARVLMQFITSQADKDGEYPTDSRFAYGWASLMLRGRGRNRTVCAPDFSRNPFDDVQDDTSLALSIHQSQAEVIRRAGVKKAMPCFYTEEVVMGQGCLLGKAIKMERKEFPTRGVTGWHILPGDPADLRRVEEKKKWERTPTYRLLGRRDILLSLLSLPVGYTAVVEDNGILSVTNANREPVWRPAEI